MEIVGFAGPAGCGKDTCADILVERYGYTRVSFAATLKRMLEVMGCPCPPTQAEKERIIPWLGVSWRHLGQTLGTEWGRLNVHPDIWVILTLRGLDPQGRYVVSDVRFENEAKAIREAGGRIIHLTGRAHEMSAATAGHASEKPITRKGADLVLDNGPDVSLSMLSYDLGSVVLPA